MRVTLKRLGRPAVARLAYYSGYCHAAEALGFHQGGRIVSYHGINDRQANPYAVSTQDFAAHMAFLAGHCTVISVDQLVAWLSNGVPLPRRAVAITIDDGYEDAYSQAYPVLRRLGLTATVFLPVGFIDGMRPTGEAMVQTEFLSWQQVREMSHGGITFGSHTWSHASLSRLAAQEVKEELERSRERLQAETGKPVTGFAFPYGTARAVSPALGRQVAAAGYAWAVTGLSGLNTPKTNPYALRRTKVEAGDSLALFRKAMQGALDPWVVVDRMGRFL